MPSSGVPSLTTVADGDPLGQREGGAGQAGADVVRLSRPRCGKAGGQDGVRGGDQDDAQAGKDPCRVGQGGAAAVEDHVAGAVEACAFGMP